jgi:putative endonuclease
MPRCQKTFWVYILASGRNGTLYIGVTSNVAARVYQHKEGLPRGFTKKYGVTRLVHCEPFESVSYAIQREKTLKKWPRKWKLDLIERDNPQWRDLAEDPLW